jgi:hypothetical protein
MAAGYMELADAYAAGARVNKTHALAFRRKATDYRTIDSPLVLRFAQNVEKMSNVPAGGVQLAFGLPKGSAAPPVLLHNIASGMQLSAGDEEKAQMLAIQRDVSLAVCRAAGAPNDAARTEEVLGHASALIPRASFESTISEILTLESALVAREDGRPRESGSRAPSRRADRLRCRAPVQLEVKTAACRSRRT